MKLDLSDLATIKASADFFLSKEAKLHVLFNNAGVLAIGADGPHTSAQGHEIHLGVNVLGTFLLSKLLSPILVSTAKTEPVGSIRVIWVSSSGTEIVGDKSVSLSIDDLEAHAKKPAMNRYALSKAGNWLHGVEYAKRFKPDSVVSIALNPGNLDSEIYKQHPDFTQRIMRLLVLYPSTYGGYTLLYAGISNEITLEKTGSWGE